MTTRGRCLCGAVTYAAEAAPAAPVACHCGQCRRQSGHYWAASQVPEDALAIDGDVTWFESSPGVRRGFCAVCGSVMFWRREGEDTVSVSAGSLDMPEGMRLERHIFTGDAGRYYEIADGLPRS